jgi:hypothetical protein
MTWLKRNLFLVMGGVLAIALLGGAGFFLWSQKQQADGVTGELEGLITDLQTLTGRDPFPNSGNIDLTKVEQKRLADLLEDCRRYFVPASTYTNIDSATFKEVLENTIAELEKGAQRSGVSLPEKFSFTFKPQRDTTVFTSTDLLPLTGELADIRAICEVLYQARVHSLSGIRRVPVGKSDQGSTEFLTSLKATTNAVVGAGVTPYEFAFQGFSGELANVLEGFSRSPHCLIVKNVNVEVASASAASAEGEGASAAYQATGATAPVPAALSNAEQMRRRYGLRGPMGGPGGPGGPGSRNPYGRATGPTPAVPYATATPAAPVRRGPETVLDEKPLKITMLIDSVRIPPRAK